MILDLKKVLIIYIILLSFFVGTLLVVCLIPSSLQRKNLAKTITILEKEGVYPSVGLPWRKITLDNFTDALMFNTAYSVNSKKPLESALLNYNYSDPQDSINQIKGLKSIYSNSKIVKGQYERYWHGYLIFLRPLLVIFSYAGIRNVILFFLGTSFISFCYISWKKLGKKLTIAFIAGLLSVDFFFISHSLQFSSVFLIGLFSSLYLLLEHKHGQSFYWLFFVVGAITSFFDLLTAPMISLGMLLIVSQCLDNKTIKSLLAKCSFWSVGYLLLWASKWIIAELFFSKGAMHNALNQVFDRTVNKADDHFSRIATIHLNFSQLVGYDKRDKIFLLCFGIVFCLVWLKYFSFQKKSIHSIMPWIFIAAIPYGWYIVVANHSYLHVWFTYRDQFMTVVSAIMIVTHLMNWEHVYRDINLFKKFLHLSSPAAPKNH